MDVRLRQSYRVPFLLAVCLLTALVAPRACSEFRVQSASWLAPTADAEVRESASVRLLEEVATLREENRRLREQARARPRGDLGEIAEWSERDPGHGLVAELIPARVVHRTTSSRRRSFLVDVGGRDELRTGLAVTAGRSLCGLVRVVTERAAEVLRIDDVQFPALPVRIDREVPVAAPELPPGIEPGSPDAAAFRTAVPERPLGICRGAGDGTLTVSYLAAGDARAGDLVLTGPGAYPVPEGLVLGRVERVHDDDRDGDWEAEVRPLRDLDRLGALFVVLREPLSDELRGGR